MERTELTFYETVIFDRPDEPWSWFGRIKKNLGSGNSPKGDDSEKASQKAIQACGGEEDPPIG